MATQNNLLGSFNLTGLRHAPKRQTMIEVAFELLADGILAVTANDVTNPESVGAIRVVQNRNRLSDAEVERMAREAEVLWAEDDGWPETT